MKDLGSKGKEIVKIDSNEVHIKKFNLISFHNQFNVIKFDLTNFVLWKKKILRILKSYEFEDFVLGHFHSPSRRDWKGKANVDFRY